MLCIEDKREMDRGGETIPRSRISLNAAGDSRDTSPDAPESLRSDHTVKTTSSSSENTILQDERKSSATRCPIKELVESLSTRRGHGTMGRCGLDCWLFRDWASRFGRV
jgi:hypothetical protein